MTTRSCSSATLATSRSLLHRVDDTGGGAGIDEQQQLGPSGDGRSQPVRIEVVAVFLPAEHHPGLSSAEADEVVDEEARSQHDDLIAGGGCTPGTRRLGPASRRWSRRLRIRGRPRCRCRGPACARPLRAAGPCLSSATAGRLPERPAPPRRCGEAAAPIMPPARLITSMPRLLATAAHVLRPYRAGHSRGHARSGRDHTGGACAVARHAAQVR